MIFTSLITFITNIFTYIVSLFPTANATVVSYMETAIYNIKSSLAWANWFFPIDVLFFCINAFLVIVATVMYIKLVRWIASVLSMNLLH